MTEDEQKASEKKSCRTSPTAMSKEVDAAVEEKQGDYVEL